MSDTIQKDKHLILTTKKNSNSEWSKLYNNFKCATNPSNIDVVIKGMCDQLVEDKKNIDEGKEISDCAIIAPRSGSSLNKKYKLANQMAIMMFNPRDSNDHGKIWAQCQYNSLIRELTSYYHKREKDEFEKKMELKKTKSNNSMCSWTKAKNSDMSKVISEPKPMPVDVSKYEELETFF